MNAILPCALVLLRAPLLYASLLSGSLFCTRVFAGPAEEAALRREVDALKAQVVELRTKLAQIHASTQNGQAPATPTSQVVTTTQAMLPSLLNISLPAMPEKYNITLKDNPIKSTARNKWMKENIPGRAVRVQGFISVVFSNIEPVSDRWIRITISAGKIDAWGGISGELAVDCEILKKQLSEEELLNIKNGDAIEVSGVVKDFQFGADGDGWKFWAALGPCKCLKFTPQKDKH